uniref:Uncharacterized protein n=1 Tax=Setaria viridis TaxID=4556 RepID=A0A4U6UAZ4_SETVI|nr:hypothetical protein SEVIR_5G029900v2 [Setaria viridis]
MLPTSTWNSIPETIVMLKASDTSLRNSLGNTTTSSTEGRAHLVARILYASWATCRAIWPAPRRAPPPAPHAAALLEPGPRRVGLTPARYIWPGRSISTVHTYPLEPLHQVIHKSRGPRLRHLSSGPRTRVRRPTTLLASLSLSEVGSRDGMVEQCGDRFGGARGSPAPPPNESFSPSSSPSRQLTSSTASTSKEDLSILANNCDEPHNRCGEKKTEFGRNDRCREKLWV